MNLQQTVRAVVLASVCGDILTGCGGVPPVRTQGVQNSFAMLVRYEYSEIHMGVRTRLIVYAGSEDAAIDACRAAFARVTAVDQAASDYLIDSELNCLCKSPPGRPFRLSDDLFTLLTEANRLSDYSSGCFDITVGPYVALWRAARKSQQLPTHESLATAGERVGYHHLKVDAIRHTATLDRADIKVDLGGIAKGYAGDCAIQTLRERGIVSAFFEAGGDVVVSAAPPGTDGWRIDMDHPGDDMPATLIIQNSAVSTSGDTQQFVEIAGQHYSHVVDPRTGMAVTTRKMGTVISPKGIWADALSKTVYLIAPDKLDDLLSHYPGACAYVRTLR